MTTTTRLAAALAALGGGLSPAEQHTALAVYGLLAGGRPVTAGRLAQRVGGDRDRVGERLDALPDVERDRQGRLVGLGGLTLRPTPYRLELGRHVLHARCPLDGLVAVVALDAAGELSAACPETGRSVWLGVTPDATPHRRPDSAALSFRDPTGLDPGGQRGQLCALTRLFADADAAARWTARVPPAFVLGIDDAFAISREVVRRRYGRARTLTAG